MNRIKILVGIAVMLATAMGSVSCIEQDNDTINEMKSDELISENDIVNKVRQSDRIYVTEYAVQKIVTADDIKKMNIGKMSFKMPIGDRKVAIPMDAILKAYIDFETFSSDDITISREPHRLSVKIAAPKVEMTSSKINHKEIKEFTDFFRSSFSDKELTNFENQGREAILASIPKLGIVRRAEQNARDILVPMFMQFGFGANEINIEFKN